MFDEEAIQARRNPLSKQQERQAKQEVKKYHDPNRRPDQVYVLAVCPEDPIIFYVGVALDPHKRFESHKAAIDLGVDTKQAYEWVRYHKHKDTLFMMVLDEEGELTEEEWRQILLEQGYPLQNMVAGNDGKRKHRKVYEHRDLLKGKEPVPKEMPLHIQRLYAGIKEKANALSLGATERSDRPRPAPTLEEAFERLLEAHNRTS